MKPSRDSLVLACAVSGPPGHLGGSIRSGRGTRAGHQAQGPSTTAVDPQGKTVPHTFILGENTRLEHPALFPTHVGGPSRWIMGLEVRQMARPFESVASLPGKFKPEPSNGRGILREPRRLPAGEPTWTDLAHTRRTSPRASRGSKSFRGHESFDARETTGVAPARRVNDRAIATGFAAAPSTIWGT